MMHPILQAHLRPLARRLAWRTAGVRLAGAWLLAAAAAWGLWAAQRLTGGGSSLSWLVPGILGLALAARALGRTRRETFAPGPLATRLETAFPELEGRLLTAVEIQATPARGASFLEQRVIFEACDHARQRDWRRVVSRRSVALAHLGQVAALAALAASMLALRSGAPHTLLALAPPAARGLSVTPGDITLERGQNLVVLARFGGEAPATAELIWTGPGGEERRLAMVRSLSDPLFGATLPEVQHDLTYRVESAAGHSPDYRVKVFEYPRLEGTDADLEFPSYTGQPPRHIPDTRRVSAVEGTRLSLALRLNKPVASATLVPRGAAEAGPIPLTTDPAAPAAALPPFALRATRTYDLQLVDAEGRTNKEPASFVFQALPNRRPELQFTAPRGDLRPSPLEEVSFAGTVWDDFGVLRYGVAWLRPGQEPAWIELGRAIPAREKRAYEHRLALEDLALAAGDLLSWFVWAEDLGPDGEPRRTTSDLYFAEVRPFDEVFRDASGEAGSQASSEGEGQAGGEGENPSAQLVELQKQILTATWKLLRDLPAAPPAAPPTTSRRVPLHPTGQIAAPAAPPRTSRRAAFLAQPAPEGAPRRASRPALPTPRERGAGATSLREDLEVIREAQARVLEQARAAGAEARDPRQAAAWEAALQAMQTALEKLEAAGHSPEALREAFAAEQAAYQALLRLQEREFGVTRNRGNRSGQQGGNSRQQAMQRQLDQLELTREENRYETESRAAPPDSPERREQLQILNRLRELARRQEDLNERLRELQAALEAARTPEERDRLRRELRRLQEQQQETLAGLDELQQRLDQTENLSRLAETRQQLEQTRQELQRANQALREEAASRALAAGTRAREQLEQAGEDLRRASAGEFDADLRDLRAGARQLTREQEALARDLETLAQPDRRSLSDATPRQELMDRLARQRQQLTNLLERATELSRQTEEPEPLVSRQLYDTLRRFSQDDGSRMRQMRQSLLERGQLTYQLDDRLEQGANRPAQGVELTAELLRHHLPGPAREAAERAQADLDQLRRGIEQAAERLLGDDAEDLRRARSELEALADQVQRETPQSPRPTAEAGGAAEDPSDPSGRSDLSDRTFPGGAERFSLNLDDLLDAPARTPRDDLALEGPITGADFGRWADRLREVEELVEFPDLRTRLARARERARQLRQEFRRDLRKPDWAVLNLEVLRPLVEVRDQIAEELARRDPGDALVPVDRDPVPARFSELVRRYYEELGRAPRP